MEHIAPSALLLTSAFIAFAVLAATNRWSIRQVLRGNGWGSSTELMGRALPDRIAASAVVAAGMLCVGRADGAPLVVSMGLIFCGTLLGFLLNVPILGLTAAAGARAATALQDDARKLLQQGEVIAGEEVDRGTQQARIWNGALKDANDDPVVADAIYVRRRSRAWAKERILEGGAWERWIAVAHLDVSALVENGTVSPIAQTPPMADAVERAQAAS